MMKAKALALTNVAAALLLGGCVAAVIGNAPNSGTAGDSRARGEATSDAALASAVRARLGADAQLRHAPVTVSAAGGTVTLRGKVASAAQRVAAERAVRGVAGVTAVNNQLEVN
jgi:osmotically-inducible protein OsmY